MHHRQSADIKIAAELSPLQSGDPLYRSEQGTRELHGDGDDGITAVTAVVPR